MHLTSRSEAERGICMNVSTSYSIFKSISPRQRQRCPNPAKYQNSDHTLHRSQFISTQLLTHPLCPSPIPIVLPYAI